MATLGDILKQNKISLKSSVEPHYRRFSDAYLSLKGDPKYADLVTFEHDCEQTLVSKTTNRPWTVAALDEVVKVCNTYDKFVSAFANTIPQLNVVNNIYTDELLRTIWTQILMLKQQVH